MGTPGASFCSVFMICPSAKEQAGPLLLLNHKIDPLPDCTESDLASVSNIVRLDKRQSL